VCSHSRHSRCDSIIAELSLLEEEVDTPSWPTHTAAALGELPLSALRNLEDRDFFVEPLYGISPLKQIHQFLE
jgi:hypothetical protein